MKVFIGIFWCLALTCSVFACAWGPPYATVCEKCANSDAVIVATITDVVNEHEGEQEVALKIEKTYKGSLSGEIVLDQPLSTCDWDFTNYSGEKVLLYLRLDKKNKTYHAIGTGYGGSISSQMSDLYWLEDVKNSLKRTRIAGDIGIYKGDYGLSLEKYLSDALVTISDGKRSYSTRTDSNGVYQFWDIPFGRYKIIPTFEDRHSLRFATELGNISWKKLSKNNIDMENFEVIIGKKSMCGGANYVLENKNDTDHP